MSRKNIFEIVNEKFDLHREILRMKRLFEDEEIMEDDLYTYTILEAVKDVGFAAWKNRGRCVDAEDFLSMLNYDFLWNNATNSETDLLTLIEIIYNFWYIVYKKTDLSFCDCEREKRFFLLKEIMDECLTQYNYKGEYFPDLAQLIVVEDKPEATAVAEIVDKEIVRKILRYNHYTLKGNLSAKKEILIALGAELEPKRKQLHTINSSLEDGIFYILNNMNLRHNNKIPGDKNYNQTAAEMDNDTLEGWYDELYQMILLAHLQLDQIDRDAKVKALKQTASGG